ncbi:MAG: hypothetical protein O7B23_05315 [Deltaproteobacteria bacterium]|nr:hypothetical protein [Deltaproteobacteria bacterium]
MNELNQDPRKIRSRLRSYERKLEKEKKEHGFYRDGAGKRYQIGPHYMLLGDNDGALAAFQWFAREFPDDVGEPGHLLCWSLALYRAGNEIGAAKKLRQTMFSNLYLLPRLLGSQIAELDIWHGSSDAEPSYAEHIHEPYLALWTDDERDWASRLYESAGFQAARKRYIEISRLLDTTRPGPERSRLVEEMHELER